MMTAWAGLSTFMERIHKMQESTILHCCLRLFFQIDVAYILLNYMDCFPFWLYILIDVHIASCLPVLFSFFFFLFRG